MIGACKKIVRLILMSNISRRKFLKGAGVAALAVAASSVLAGCSGSTSVPDKPTPGVPDKTVHIYYMINVQPVNGEPVEISVNGLATYVTYETIKANIPADAAADYDCAKKNYDIEKDGTVTVKLQKKASAKPQKPVKITYTTGTSEVISTDFKLYELEVDENATALTQKQLDSLPSENCAYRILKADEKFFGYSQGVIKDGVATVYVEAKN